MTDRSAVAESGRSFFDASSGRWAGEQFLKALKEGKSMSPSILRTLDTLRKDEWVAFDNVLVEEGKIRLQAVGDLRAAGLVKNIPNGMGKTMMEYEKVTDMEPAQTSLDGMARTENDRLEFELGRLPLPITHKDFNINLRQLVASRTTGEPLDTMQSRVSGRLVTEKVEDMLFNGGPQFGGSPIYGYLTHPDINTVNFVANGAWDAGAKTGENILDDILLMMAAAEDDRFYGPYVLYIPKTWMRALQVDFKANSDKSILSRVQEISGLTAIRSSDKLTADKGVLVQMTSDVVMLVEGEPLQTIQWDINGGFQVNFKAFTIQVPLIRSDADGRSGVTVIEAA